MKSITTPSGIEVLVDQARAGELTDRGAKAKAWAESLAIKSASDADAAWTAILVCRQRIDEADALTEPAREKTKAAYDEVLALRKKLQEPYRLANEIMTPKLTAWKEAERKKLDEERAQKQEEARKAEEERRIAEARALEAEGRQAEAEALMDEPVQVPAVPEPEPETKLAGGAVTETWRAELVSMAQLIGHLLSTPDHANALAADKKTREAIEAVFSRMARALRGSLTVPGLRVVREQQLRRTGKRNGGAA